MTTTEAVVVSVAIASATVASIFHGLSDPLVGIISAALGYGGGRVVGNKVGGPSIVK